MHRSTHCAACMVDMAPDCIGRCGNITASLDTRGLEAHILNMMLNAYLHIPQSSDLVCTGSSNRW